MHAHANCIKCALRERHASAAWLCAAHCVECIDMEEEKTFRNKYPTRSVLAFIAQLCRGVQQPFVTHMCSLTRFLLLLLLPACLSVCTLSICRCYRQAATTPIPDSLMPTPCEVSRAIHRLPTAAWRGDDRPATGNRHSFNGLWPGIWCIGLYCDRS